MKIWLTSVEVSRNRGFRQAELRRILRLVTANRQRLLEAWEDHHGPRTTMDRGPEKDRSLQPGARVRGVRFEGDRMSVDLADGRTITVPLGWYPRLREASPEQRERWELAGGGYGIHWPEVDEDLSVEGLLRGIRAAGGEAPVL